MCMCHRFLSFRIVILCERTTMVQCVVYIHEHRMALTFDLNIKLYFHHEFVTDKIIALWHRLIKFWYIVFQPWNNWLCTFLAFVFPDVWPICGWQEEGGSDYPLWVLLMGFILFNHFYREKKFVSAYCIVTSNVLTVTDEKHKRCIFPILLVDVLRSYWKNGVPFIGQYSFRIIKTPFITHWNMSCVV